MGANERVVVQVRVGAVDPVDLLGLAGAQPLVRVEAPRPREQPLAAEDLVQPAMQPAKSWAASKKAALASVTRTAVRRSSDGIVPAAAAAWHSPSSSTARLVQTDQWPSRPPTIRRSTGPRGVSNAVGGHQVVHDGVVVPGVEGDVVAARLGDGADDVEGLVAVERGDLDRDHALDLGELPPERIGAAARPPTLGWR